MKTITFEIEDAFYINAEMQLAKSNISVEQKLIKIIQSYADEYINGLAMENLKNEVNRLKIEKKFPSYALK